MKALGDPWGILGANGAMSAWQPLIPGAAEDSEEITDAYRQETRVAACVNLFATAQALTRLRLYDGDPDDDASSEVTDESNPLVRLLRSPHPLLSQRQMRVLDGTNVLLHNESVHLLRDRAGQPVRTTGRESNMLVEVPASIHPVPGAWADLERDKASQWPTEWKVRSGAKELIHPFASSVIHGEFPDAGKLPRMVGRLAQAIGPANARYLASRFQAYLMRNYGGGGETIQMEGMLPPPEEADNLRDWYREAWDDPENAGATRLLWGGKQAGTAATPKDLAWEAVHALAKADIAEVFATSKALLGEGSSNYATFSGEFTTYVQLRFVPWTELYVAGWNSWIGRLRDNRAARYRVRADTERLDTLFADPEQQSQNAERLAGMGVPLDEALRQGGLKVDPIDGGDVPMVGAGRFTLRASILMSQARAAKAAIDARMDPAQAWQHAGVEGAVLVEPEPEPAPEPDQNDEREGGKDDDGGEGREAAPPAKSLPAEGESTAGGAVPAHRAAGTPSARRKSLSDADVEGWANRLEELEDPIAAKMERQVRGALYQMGIAQKRALEQFAETGEISRASAYRRTPARRALGDADIWEDVDPLYSGSMPILDEDEARSLLAALRHDIGVGLRRVEVRDCCGVIDERAGYEAECDDMRQLWADVHGGGRDLLRCQDALLLGRMDKATLTEEQLDALLIVTDAAWTEVLVERVLPLTISAYESTARDISSIAGLPVFVDTQNPDWLRAMRDHAVQVVEGTQSTLAMRVRSDWIRVMADKPTLPTLQQTIKDSLDDLKASTTRAFADRYQRAEAIARTETRGASSRANHDGMVQLFHEGVIKAKEWATIGGLPEPEGTVRIEHYEANGQQVQPGTPYIVGGVQMMHPLDSNAPARLVVRCRCKDKPVLADLPDDEE